MTADTIRVLIVDDHEIVRMGLVTLFRNEPDIDVVDAVGTMADAVARAAALAPDVVLLDVRLPDGSGVEAARDIRAQNSRIRIVFLTSFEDEAAVLETVFAGADGFLLKEVGGASLVRAIRTVAQGQPILDPIAARPVLDRMRALAGGEQKRETLSPQEHRVLALVAEGKTNKEIAAELHLSSKTVKNYLSNIFQKLEVKRRAEAAAHFVRASKA